MHWMLGRQEEYGMVHVPRKLYIFGFIRFQGKKIERECKKKGNKMKIAF